MQEQPERELIKYDGVQIEVLLRGRGPLIVMLPSGGRGSEDFDPVAARRPPKASVWPARSRGALAPASDR